MLGRHPDCDIVLDSGAVSRQHARIVGENGQLFVEDLHSRNGTYINDQPIQGRRALSDGDRLRICELVLKFEAEIPRPTSLSTAAIDESSLAIMVEDTELKSSTFLSKFDITSDSSRMRIEINPQAKLLAILEITKNLSRSLSIDAVLPKVLDSLFKIFLQADRGFIVLKVGQPPR